jgi:hypothetical protein
MVRHQNHRDLSVLECMAMPLRGGARSVASESPSRGRQPALSAVVDRGGISRTRVLSAPSRPRLGISWRQAAPDDIKV